jgi:DNA mismatch endonuclease (patch repair protein)
MQGNRRSDTAPELALRRRLHGEGLRFRKDALVVAGDAKTRADVVFSRQRVAVFLDGCYWHGCPEHCRMPTRNRAYWQAKIARNVSRDERLTEALQAEGWRVLRVWEHEPVEEAAARVKHALALAQDAAQTASAA